MVQLGLIRDDVNSSEALAFALQRVFGWTDRIAADFAHRAHAAGSVQLGEYPEAEANELAARLLVFGLLPRITARR